MQNGAEIRVWERLGLAVSHILVSPVSTLFLVVYLSRNADVPVASQGNFLALTFIGLGLATIFQALKRRFVGSGFLAVSGFSTAYTGVLLAAARVGGLPLVAGMTVFAGIIELAVAPVLPYLRVFFPASVVAVILALIGIYVGESGVDLLTGANETRVSDWMVHVVAGGVVFVIFALTVWGTRRLRQMALLAGLTAGLVVLWLFNLVPEDADRALRSNVWLAWPRPALAILAFDFDSRFALPFALLPVVVAIRHVGLIGTLQRETQVEWKEVDMGNVARAQVASGLGTILSGLAGAGPTAIGSNSVALASQSKIFDRLIAFLAGGLLVLIGLSPAVYTLLLIIPDPLLGAAMLALGATMLVGALKIVDFQHIRPEATLILGTGLILGLHVEIHGSVYENLPQIIENVASSGMVVGVIAASVLNLLFVVGRKWGRLGRDV